MDNILCIFEKYQTFFTGLLGFAGVIMTMIVNARHQRAMHDRKLQHEAQTLRVALRAELDANRMAFEGRIQQLDEKTDFGHALVPNQPINQIYSNHLNKLGMLSVEEIERVIKAYLLISDLFFRMRILVGTDNVIGINNEIIRLDQKKLSAASDMHKSFLPDIKKAIESIDKNIG